MKYLSGTNCEIKNIIFLTFFLATFMILLYIPFDKNFITDISKNFTMKDSLLVFLFTVLLITSRFLITYTFKVSPNIGYTHLIINANIIITLIASYLLFNEKINYQSFIGMLITLVGLAITILYSS
tara:strand:- start:1128 stop:1505 length:378 start_codon:yes stop_codon:yes gene_type:complete